MRNTYKLIAVLAGLMLVLALSGCDAQKAPAGSDDPQAAVPTLVVGGEEDSTSDEKGAFIIGDFTAVKSAALRLGGSRTDKIEKMENAQIQREAVPENAIEWIPGIW